MNAVTTPNVPAWARPALQAERRAERRPALTREGIVAAAIGVADSDGLDALSMRRVAADLDARVMTLYSHVASKDDLLDLMFDALAGEAVLDDVPAGWRPALVELAGRKRRLCLAHPWMVTLFSLRPRAGPNSLRQLDRAMAAVADLTADPAAAAAVVSAVDDYTLGHVTRELTYRDDAALRPYLRELADSGDYPTLAPLLLEPVPPDHDATFALGLAWLLDGLGQDAAIANTTTTKPAPTAHRAAPSANRQPA